MSDSRRPHRIPAALLAAALAAAAVLATVLGPGADGAAAQERARFLPYGATLRVVIDPPGAAPARSWAGWQDAAGPMRWIAENGIDDDAEAAIAWRGDLWTGPDRVAAVTRNLVRRFLDRPVLGTGSAAARAPETAVLGGTVLVYATGFAPPNEFCSPVQVRVDGSSRSVRRLADSQGNWALRFGIGGTPGLRAVELRQVCTGGPSGQRTDVTRARAFVRAVG